MADLAEQIGAMRDELARYVTTLEPVSSPERIELLERLTTALEELRAAHEALQEQNAGLQRAQAEADRERQRYAELFESAPDGLVVTDLQNKIHQVNHAAAALLGIERNFLIGRPFFAYVKSRSDEGLDWLELQEAARTLRAGQAISNWEARLNAWGTRRPTVLLSAAPILDGGMKVGLQWSLRDVTEEREAEQRYLTAFENNPAPTLIAKLEDATLVNVYQEFSTASGLTRGELVGKTLKDLGLFAEVRTLAELLAALLREEVVHRQEAMLSISGERRIALLSARPVRMWGEAYGIITFLDITERKLSDENLMRAIEETMQDASWFSQVLVEKLKQVRSGTADAPAVAELTPRERQVLSCIAKGLNNKQIGDDLSLSHQTVRNYVASIYSKLGVRSRAEAVVWARERGVAA